VITAATQRLRTALRRLRGEERGASMVEYGLLIGLIALVAVTGLRYFGDSVTNTLYSESGNRIASATSP
jgi:Flp pilus assembly pilin Flp